MITYPRWHAVNGSYSVEQELLLLNLGFLLYFCCIIDYYLKGWNTYGSWYGDATSLRKLKKIVLQWEEIAVRDIMIILELLQQ